MRTVGHFAISTTLLVRVGAKCARATTVEPITTIQSATMIQKEGRTAALPGVLMDERG